MPYYISVKNEKYQMLWATRAMYPMAFQWDLGQSSWNTDQIHRERGEQSKHSKSAKSLHTSQNRSNKCAMDPPANIIFIVCSMIIIIIIITIIIIIIIITIIIIIIIVFIRKQCSSLSIIQLQNDKASGKGTN